MVAVVEETIREQRLKLCADIIDRYQEFDLPTYKELAQLMGTEISNWSSVQSHTYLFQDLWELRTLYIKAVGFGLYTKELASDLGALLSGKRVLEVGSGTGYLARLLQNSGIAVSPYDNRATEYSFNSTDSYTNITLADAVPKVRSSYNVVLMTWPDYASPFANKVISRMRKHQLLVYLGESHGGCTGDDKFFQRLSKSFTHLEVESDQLNSYHMQFYGLHDRWYVFRKTRNH